MKPNSQKKFQIFWEERKATFLWTNIVFCLDHDILNQNLNISKISIYQDSFLTLRKTIPQNPMAKCSSNLIRIYIYIINYMRLKSSSNEQTILKEIFYGITSSYIWSLKLGMLSLTQAAFIVCNPFSAWVGASYQIFLKGEGLDRISIFRELLGKRGVTFFQGGLRFLHKK